MNKEIWEGFKAGKNVINCTTEEEAKEFMKLCESDGYVWCYGAKPTEKTNLTANNTCYRGDYQVLNYSSANYYKAANYTVKTYKELMERNMKTFEEVIESIKEGQEYKTVEDNYRIKSIQKVDGDIRIVNECIGKAIRIPGDCEFELVQKPMTFMEAVNSGNLIKHESWNNFYSLDIVIEILNGFLKEKQKELFNGKWYAES